MGSTVETVVMTVCGFTRAPTWTVAIPTMPSIGDVILVQPRLRAAWSTAARAAATAARRVALRRHRVVELLLADGPLGGQGRETLDVLRGPGELGFGPAERPLRLGEGGPELARVDLEQAVAPPDELAILVELPHQVALDLGPDVGVHRAVQRADPFAHDRHVLLDDGRDEDVGRRRGRRRLCRAAGGERRGEKEQ